jgi:hypothetical protein
MKGPRVSRYTRYLLLPIMLLCPSRALFGYRASVLAITAGGSYGFSPVESGATVQPKFMTDAGDESAPTSFPLDQPGEHVSHFREARTGEMTLVLRVEGRSGETARPLLTHLKTVIEATLRNRAGRTICRAAGSPIDNVSGDGWVLATTGSQAYFWHRHCGEIKLKHSELYTLTILVIDVDPMTPSIRVTPSFERSDAYGP